MPTYRRWYVPGGTYFFTIVTRDRRPIFRDPMSCRLLGRVMREVREDRPFVTTAVVLLPDHLHCIWTLPAGDSDFSTRWRLIKGGFAGRWVAAGHRESRPDASRLARGELGVWQRRFWERVVRDEAELEHLCDYIHYNPVKHGCATSPGGWPWSSFRRFVREGHYDADWGRSPPVGDPGPVGE